MIKINLKLHTDVDEEERDVLLSGCK
jgi:hypothetical protein